MWWYPIDGSNRVCGPINFALWASYQIRKIAGCACAGNAGNVSPCRRFQRKPLVSDPGMHHGTCVTHVPWCMSGSLTCGDRENVPGIPGACAPAILRIWQEAHCQSHRKHNRQYFTDIQSLAMTRQVSLHTPLLVTHCHSRPHAAHRLSLPACMYLNPFH